MDKKLSMLEKISKKDLIYGFVIFDLFMVLITVIVWKYYSAQELIDQISFGSTLASILLAVVAMVYSFIQSYESLSQQTLVQQALISISDKVDEFGTMKDELATFRSDAKSYNEHMLKTMNSFVEQAAEQVDSIFELLRERGLDVPEDVEKDIAEAYRGKFNQEMLRIRERFPANPDIALRNELLTLFMNHFQKGHEITLLELVDLLVYKGLDFEGPSLLGALESLEKIGRITLSDSDRGRIVKLN